MPVLISFLLALYCLRSAWWRPGEVLIGGWAHPDTLSNHWLLAWVAERLASGQGILHNGDYYWPVGDAPVLAGNGGEGLAYLPFHLLLGWPHGVAPYAVTILTLNGVAGAALARSVGASAPASWLAAAATVCFPYTLQELSAGRFSQVSICWGLFALAAFFRLLDDPTRRRTAVCGVLLAVTGFFYWYYALFTCLAIGVVLLARWRDIPWKSVVGALGLSAILIAPWLALFVANFAAIPGAEEAFPSPHAAMKSAPLTPRLLIGGGLDSHHTMSAVPWLLGLAGIGVAIRSWQGRALAGVAVLFAVLSLGPAGGLYTALYGLAAPLRRFWWPLRHVVFLNAAWTAGAALALTALLARLSERWRPLVALLAVLSVPIGLTAQGIETQPKYTAITLPPPVYPALAEDPGHVLIEPPLLPALASTQQTLIYQRYHQQRLLGGHALWVDRLRPATWDATVASSSFLAALQGLERGEAGDEFAFSGEDLQSLLDADVRYLSINRELFPLKFKTLIRRYRDIATALFGEPVQRTTGLWIWDLRQWSGETAVAITPWTWPASVRPGGPEISISGRRPASVSFGEVDEASGLMSP
ncbi:MAG: hypothetical protein ACI8RZ_004673 [Myxococcota bacterium]|jgi:hypothetical protein